MEFSYKYSKLSKIEFRLDNDDIKKMVKEYLEKQNILPKDKKVKEIEIDLNEAGTDFDSEKYMPASIKVVYHYEERIDS